MSRASRAGLLLGLLHLSIIPCTGQGRETVSQGIEWFSYTSNISLNKRVSLMTEGQFRFAQQFEPMQFQARTGVDIVLNKHWVVMPIGYVYTWNPLYGKQPNTYVNNEHRLFEQVVFKHNSGKVKFSHRLRLEQRFLQVHSQENNTIVDQGYDNHVNRVRYRFQAQVPIQTAQDGSPLLSAVVYDEIFLSFGGSVTYNKPDQNRIFTGVAYHFSKNLTLQGGPFYQLMIKSNGTKQENNIGVQVSLAHNLDLSKE